MKREQVALQCYTLRDHCKTAADFAASMKKTRAIGYPAVQISGIGPIPPEQVRRICEGEGLAICATHEPGKTIVEEPRAVVDRLATLGCRHTAYPYPHVTFATEDDVKRLAAGLNQAGAVLKQANMTLSYHNHAIEFRRIGTKTILEILYAETDPDLVQGEIDTYWVQTGGADPVDWCRRLRGRLPLLHMKDYAIDAENRPQMAPVGGGNLNFPSIVRAAEESGSEWFIVEQDSGFDDAFVAITQSYRYVTEQLCS
jgi:sugar phosphate isomerase/epimerase